MTRAFFIAVELIDGKPALELPPSVTITRAGSFFHLDWNGHHLTLHNLGVYPGTGQRVFLGAGTRQVMTALDHLPSANVYRLKDVLTKPVAVRTWLRDVVGLRAIRRVSDSAIVGILPSVVLAGTDPIASGLDYEMEDRDPEGESPYELV